MRENNQFDVIVIGGGIVGGLILRELTKYELRVAMLEKENDVCMGASKANSGIVHAGYDAPMDTNKARFNVQGNGMMRALAQELGVHFRQNGSLVVAFSREEKETLYSLKERGEINGVQGLQILNGEELRAKEPNVSQDAIAALYAPTGGIVNPYALTIAAVGNAMDNGAKLYTNFEVCKIERQEKGYLVSDSFGNSFGSSLVVNCAGVAAGKIAALINDNIVVRARKGEYLLLDRESGDFLSHTLFFTPTKRGKGVLLTPTVDGNMLYGPTAEELETPNLETTSAGLAQIIEKVNKMCKNPPFYSVITSFAGVRAFLPERDFLIEESKNSQGFIHCAGIESPGLTAAPAIAKYVVEGLVAKRLPLRKNQSFNGKRRPFDEFQRLSADEKRKKIKENPAFGRVVCRCEGITEGEIVQAIHQNPPARDIDGIKRRTRCGMGRCQGGFCQTQVAEILARECNIPLERVTKKGKDSAVLLGRTK